MLHGERAKATVAFSAAGTSQTPFGAEISSIWRSLRYLPAVVPLYLQIESDSVSLKFPDSEPYQDAKRSVVRNN
jgi:hypothetical protein